MVFISAMIEGIRNTCGRTVRDVMSTAHHLLGVFARNTDPDVGDAMADAAADPSTDFITAPTPYCCLLYTSPSPRD